MEQRKFVESLLIEALQQYAAQSGSDFEIGPETPLFGVGAPLDSLGLVTVLADFEAALNDTFGANIILADERAMSMERSPFRTVSSLVAYACALIGANGDTP